MKKVLMMVMALLMMVTSIGAFAEDAPAAEAKTTTSNSEKIIGIWYMNQLVNEGKAYDVSQMPNQNIIEFKQGNTGVIYAKDDESTQGQIAWKEDEEGKLWLQEESTQVPMQISIYNDPEKENEIYLVIGDESNSYVLNREPTAPVNFAPIVKAESMDVFNGKYALTYLAGDGYTLRIEDAMEDLASLGITTTEINIDNGVVELMGSQPAAFTFNQEEGSLEKVIEENIQFMNAYIYKTETGLAVNWFDLTFYAEPVTE